ncbi:MAG: EF-hand domain-containing protein [Gammaproteobacteria bacterium]|nr:EF-hand domain-containing protein [Gammaproteobacteria bacterium]
MKKQLVKNLFITCMIVMSTPLLADSYTHGDGKSRFMSYFDTNGDNAVNMVEFNEAVAKRFDTMDSDNNSVVSKEEFQAYMTQKRDERHEQKFQSMDNNKDGQVSRDEYISYKQKYAETRFQSMDTNSDGVISKEEFAAHKASRQGHKHGHHDYHSKDNHGKDNGKIFTKLDANNDGQLTRDESLTAWTNWFKRLDANGDQTVTLEEVRDYRSKKSSWN